MQIVLPFSPLILSVVLLGAYAFSMFWLLKREKWSTLCILLLVTLGATLLHLHQVWELPPGINDDEIKTLKSAHEYYQNGKIFVLSAQGPVLHAVLFQMPLVWWTDSVLWSMRIYPIVFGILAVPASFCAARALLFNIIPSLVTAALVTALPWALFWGRVSWGGEIVFYQALLLAAIAGIIWRGGGFIEVAIGAIALSGLLWEYTGAWSMVAMPFIGVLVARSLRQRALCFAVFLGAILLWVPYLLNFQEWWPHIANKVSLPDAAAPQPDQHHLAELVQNVTMALKRTLRVFVHPEGNVYWISMHSVAIHPLIVLVVAGLGAIVSLVRRSLFLSLGFLAGLGPTLLSFSGAPSTHRLMCAFMFIALACGAFFQFLNARIKGAKGVALTGAFAVAFVSIATYQSATLFFSDKFWTESERIFFKSETALAESIRLPVTTPLVAGPQIGRLLDARGTSLPGVTNLAHDTLLPLKPTTVTLSPAVYLLIPFYQASVPPERITSYGSGELQTSLKVEFDDSDVQRWNKHGWVVERRCSDRELKGIRVPVFLISNQLGWEQPCPGQIEAKYKARWIREPAELSLVTLGGAVVKVETSSGLSVESAKSDQAIKKIRLRTNDVVTITAPTSHGSVAWLAEGDGVTAPLPRLESFQPVQ